MIYDRFSSNGFEEKQAVVNEGVDEWSMSASRNNEAEIDLQGQDKFHQQGQRAKHEHQNPKKETLYKKICNSRSTASRGNYVISMIMIVIIPSPFM